jgi:hypothetical protein
MAFDPLSRRLGDRFGGTLVLHRTRARAGVALSRIPDRWTQREVAVAEAYLDRAAAGMDPSQALLLGRRLLALVARDAPELLSESGVSATAADPEMALRRVLGVE